MAETVLITIAEVQEVRKIDSKFDEERFETFANETQKTNLRGLLGDALYYAFMNDDRTDGIYAELLDGTTYEYNGNTIQYYGIKPYLCYLWLAIAAREGDLFMSVHGAINFTNNPQQNYETAKQKEQIAAKYLGTAQTYANDIIKFLNNNSSDYQLWEGGAEQSQTQFVTFKI